MKKLVLGLMIVVFGMGIVGGATTHAWDDCWDYPEGSDLRRECEDDTKGRNFVEEITVNVADVLRDVEEFNLRMQYYLRPYVEADLTFDQWKELYGYGSMGGGPIPGGEFRLPDAAVFGGIGANTDLRLFILNVLEWVLSFLGIVAIAVIIFAGYTYIVGGEENNEKAKKMILYSAVGIIVILSSYALVNTLITKTIEGGDNFDAVENYVSIEGIVRDIHVQAECDVTNPNCVIHSLGSSGGFTVNPYDDVKFWITGNKEIVDVQWNFGDGGLYEGIDETGTVTRSFTESKWYNVAVMGRIAKDGPDPEDADPWNRFVGQIRLWVGDIVLARFQMAQSVNPTVGQAVEFNASESTTITGGIDNYIWRCTPAAGVTPSPCADFDIQKVATSAKHKKNFFATFDAPGAVTISLVVQAKIGAETIVDSQPIEEVINVQNGGLGMNGGSVNFNVPSVVTVNIETELRATGAPADGSYEWSFSAPGTPETGDKILHTFSEEGVTSVTLIGKDADGNQIGGAVTKNVVVSPRKGIVNLVVPGIIVKDISGELRASGAPTDGSYEWTFADTTTDEGDRILHTFATEGEQVVKLIARDAVGNQIGGVVEKNIIVSAKNTGNNPIDFVMPNVLLKNVPALLRGTGAPTDGSYTWTFKGGIIGEGDKIMHTFTDEGIEDIILEATDVLGNKIGEIVAKKAIISSLAMPTAIATFEGNPVVPGIMIDFFRGIPGTQVFGTNSCDEFGDCGSAAQVTHSWKWNGASIPTAQLPQILTQVGTQVITLITTSTTDITKKGEQAFRIKVENNPPTVDFDIAEDPTLGPGFMRINITANDVDGEITRYRLKASEYGNMLATQMLPTTQNTLSTIIDLSSETGTHDVTFQVEVTDSDGGIGTTTKNEILTITPSTSSNQPPTVSIFTTPSTTGITDSIFRFFTQAYDPDGDHLTYTWTFPGGQTVFGKTAVHRFDEVGEHVAKVTVTDGLENISDEEIITIVENPGGGGGSDPDTLVKTSVEPAGINCADGGTRIEKGTDDNDNGFLDANEVATTEYACNGGGGGGGSDPDTLVKTGVEPVGVNCTNGGTRIEKGLDDNDNGFLDGSEVDTTEYACNGGSGDGDPSNNKAPQVQISGMSPGNTGDTTTQFSFFSNASDPDGDTLVYEWDFADGSTSTMKNVIHRFAQPGTYQVRLRVSDGIASREVKISVRVVAEGEIIPESTLPLYVPEYHSSSLSDSTNTTGDDNGEKVLIIAGGKKDLKSFTTEVVGILNEKREALLHCETEVECQKLQEEVDALELLAQKIVLLERETDPSRQKQLNDEITLLFAQIHELDPEIDLNLAIIEGTTNAMFFLYGEINFKTDRPISIDWETGDGRRFAGQDVSWLYPDTGLYTVTMIVSDGTASVSDTLTIKVN